MELAAFANNGSEGKAQYPGEGAKNTFPTGCVEEGSEYRCVAEVDDAKRSRCLACGRVVRIRRLVSVMFEEAAPTNPVRYWARSTVAGSTRAALRAGSHAASVVAASSTSTTTVSVAGSRAST